MKLTVTGRRMTVTEATRQQIERKIGRLDRLLHNRAVSAQCIISEERQRVTCELTVQIAGARPMHGLARDAKLVRAVSLAVEKVEQQAARLNDRQRTRRRGSRRPPAGGGTPAVEPPASSPRPRVIRAAPADIKPMTLDDAVLTLEGSERTFLVFRLSTSERTALLFRRDDGHFGLVEPEA
jgi:putative sigma-54 modulation protein